MVLRLKGFRVRWCHRRTVESRGIELDPTPDRSRVNTEAMSSLGLGVALLGDKLGRSGFELNRERPPSYERFLLLVLCQPGSAPTILGEGHSCN